MRKKTVCDNIELWEKYQEDKNNIDIKNKLIEIYYPLVQKISYKMAEKMNWKVQPDELASFGVDGLYRAIEKFEPNRGFRFSTYANIRIQGSMIDGLRREDRIPRSVRIKHNKIEDARQKLEAQKCRKVSDEELLEYLDIDITEYYKNNKKYIPNSFFSIDVIYSEDGSSDKYSNVKQDHNSNFVDYSVDEPENKILRKEFLSKLIGKDFSKLEVKIIYRYFYDNYTMENIAKEIKMSESKVSKIFNEALPRIKDKITRNPNYFQNIYNTIGKFKKE